MRLRQRQRLALVILAVLLLGGATGLVLAALQDKVTFFVTPSQIAEQHPEPGRRFRLGGLVVDGSIRREADGSVTVDGMASLRAINRRLGTRFPLDGPKTLNGLIVDHLGDILAKRGRVAEALVYWQKAMKGDDDEGELDRPRVEAKIREAQGALQAQQQRVTPPTP